MERNFVTTHNGWNANQELTFVLPGGESEDSYTNLMWAVHVDAVMVDGNEIPPQPFMGMPDDIDFRRTPTGGAHFLVKTLLTDLTIASRFESESVFDLVTYDIPLTSFRFEIHYRPRYGPGLVGADCRLLSTMAPGG